MIFPQKSFFVFMQKSVYLPQEKFLRLVAADSVSPLFFWHLLTLPTKTSKQLNINKHDERV